MQCIYPKTTDQLPPKDAAFFDEAWRHLQSDARSSMPDYFGVVSVSPLAQIGNPAIVNVFDPMHMVYRGNAVLLLNRLFTSKYIPSFFLIFLLHQNFFQIIRQNGQPYFDQV